MKYSNKGQRWLRIGFLMLALSVLLSCDSQKMTPEDEIRAWIKQGVDAAESKDTGALMDMLVDEFQGARKIDKTQSKKLLTLQFFRSKNIFLFTKIRSIDFPTTDTADVIVHVAMAGSRISDSSVLNSLRARIYRFELYLEKHDQWLLKEADWQPATVYDMQ